MDFVSCQEMLSYPCPIFSKRLSGHSAKSEMWNIAVIGRQLNFKTFLETDSNFELIHIYLLLFYSSHYLLLLLFLYFYFAVFFKDSDESQQTSVTFNSLNYTLEWVIISVLVAVTSKFRKKCRHTFAYFSIAVWSMLQNSVQCINFN